VSKDIIFDLGGVLLDTHKIKMAWHIGIWPFAKYTLCDWKNPNVEPLLFEIFRGLERSENNGRPHSTDHGSRMPLLLCQWQSGKRSDKEIITALLAYIDFLDKQHFFISQREKQVVIRSIKGMFDADILAQTTRKIDRGIDLLREIAALRNPDGTPKHRLFVLSNWDPRSFDAVYRKFHDSVFNYFGKNIMISGACGCYKPEKKIFRRCLRRFKLQPRNCIFIDDQQDNIKAAQEVGITALLFHERRYDELRQELAQLGVFS
jgi:FMN phosphatase YigB (HAD superfamily)